MIGKIDLYREVLAIEPNSKVFFPLARALAEVGRVEEAVAILETGLGFHPDHLEAKFFLVELFSRQEREDDAVRVFSGVQDSLVRYPAVWRLWSRHAAFTSRDPVLALAFLAQYFRDPGLTFAGVLEKGLEVLAGLPSSAAGADRAVAQPAPDVAGAQPDAAPDDMAPETALLADAQSPPPLRGASEVLELAGLLGMGDDETADEAIPDVSAEAAPSAPARSPRQSEPSRAASVPDMGIRTGTMAQLLAAQGDVRGALDIYEELAARLPAGPEREALKARMAELSATVAPGATRASAPAEAPVAAARKTSGKARLMGLLDTLAGRLEARVGA
jgi:tetratricopeptide (TPR) repeat protein